MQLQEIEDKVLNIGFYIVSSMLVDSLINYNVITLNTTVWYICRLEGGTDSQICWWGQQEKEPS